MPTAAGCSCSYGCKPIRDLIQVAGIRNQAEANMLAEAGVDQIGFPLRLEVHKEEISEEEAGKIIKSLKPPAYGVLITYLTEPQEISDLCSRLGARRVQLHGAATVEDIFDLRSMYHCLFITKSLVVKEGNLSELEEEVDDYSPYVDAFITDTFDPETGASGATGKVHDWNVSRRLVEVSPKPVILAGGLNSKNVREAIAWVKPAGVDVHTGVEGPDGSKDSGLVYAFISEARKGFEEIRAIKR
jgi:phosphoribosylanthranilate isomerase